MHVLVVVLEALASSNDVVQLWRYVEKANVVSQKVKGGQEAWFNMWEVTIICH